MRTREAVFVSDAARAKPENVLLFACCRRSFLDVHRQTVLHICRHRGVDWDAVYSTADLHQVAPLVHSNLLKCIDVGLAVPRGVVDQFELAFDHSIEMKATMAQELREVLSFFNARSMDVMVVKRTALDLQGEYWYAPSHDVDLVTRSRREDVTDQENAEIRAVVQGIGRNQHGHLLFELDYFEHHDTTMCGVLPVDFRRVWSDAIETRFMGQKIFVMSPEDMLISVCINSRRRRFFRLKSLFEIAEIVGGQHGPGWEDLTGKAKDYRCNEIVYAALLVTSMTVGCELADEVFVGLNVNPVKATIMWHLIRYLSQRVSLFALHPYSDWWPNVFGTRVSLGEFIYYTAHIRHLTRYLLNQRLSPREIRSIMVGGSIAVGAERGRTDE